MRDEKMKKDVFKKLIAGVLTFTVLLATAACGATQTATVDDSAALRGAEEGAGEIWIDDEQIALASEGESDQALLDMAKAAFDLVNEQRSSAGLSTLTWSTGLEDCARVRSQEIVSTWSHTRPNGTDWWTVNSNIMYGENLAKLYGTADSCVSAWMASPTHAANIMDSSFKTMAIYIYRNSDGNLYWAQEFGY